MSDSKKYSEKCSKRKVFELMDRNSELRKKNTELRDENKRLKNELEKLKNRYNIK